VTIDTRFGSIFHPMHELLLSEVFPPRPGGSGRWLYEIYRRLDHRALALVDSAADGRESRDTLGNLTVIRQSFQLSETGGFCLLGFWQYLRLLQRVRSTSRGVPIELARAARVLPEGWVLWIWRRFFAGPPYHVFAHGEEINLMGIELGGVMSSRQHRWMASFVLADASRIIANSHNTASMLRDQWNVPEQKIWVVNPGVDASYFVPAERDRVARRRLGWDDRPVLLTVGRLQARKGHDSVIQALPKVLKAFPDLLYAIVGDGSEKERLDNLVDELGVRDSVRFYSLCDDAVVLSMYQQCDLFILANRQVGSDVEGFGMVLLEAAACAKPTLAGQSGGTKEAIVDGITGRLIDGTNCRAIGEAIENLLSSPSVAYSMGAAGRRRVEQDFDWPIIAAKVSKSLGID